MLRCSSMLWFAALLCVVVFAALLCVVVPDEKPRLASRVAGAPKLVCIQGNLPLVGGS